MKVREGLVYHIRDEYFDIVSDCDVKLKPCHGRSYPAYCCHRDFDNAMIWMIPMSKNVEKYCAVYEREMFRYNHCYSIYIGEYDMQKTAFLIQELFPVYKKHILYEHTRKGRAVPVQASMRSGIRHCFDNMMDLSSRGFKCIFPDIERIMHILACTK